MTPDLAKLRKVAERAKDCSKNSSDRQRRGFWAAVPPEWNHTFADPTTVLALLDEIEKLKAGRA